MVTATFLTEDSYLGSQTEPLTLNRYNYCVSSYLNYTDPSGNSVEINIPFEEFEQAQTYGDIYRLLEKYIIIEAQRMEAEHNAREQEMLNGMQRDYDSGFMKAIMELESDIGISGIYNIVVSPLRYAYQGSSDPYGEAIRNRRQNSQNFYVGVAQFGFDIVDPITHPELITGRIYSGMFAVTNDPGILFQDQMGPALDAWDAVWTDDDQTHFNKTGYLFGQILAAVGLGCAKSCIDEGLANTTTRTGAIEDRKGTVYGVAESGSKTYKNSSDITKDIRQNKPLNSPAIDAWYGKNGTISIDENGVWTYHDWEGNSVSYPNGYPDFKSADMVRQEAPIGPFVERNKDFAKAREMGYIKSADGTWHHHEDGVTLQEVETILHDRFRHRGGISNLKKK